MVTGTDGTLQASEVTAQEVEFLAGLMGNAQEQLNLISSYSNVARANDTDFNEFARKSAVNGKVIPFLTARMTNAPFSSGTIALGMLFLDKSFSTDIYVIYFDLYAKSSGVSNVKPS